MRFKLNTNKRTISYLFFFVHLLIVFFFYSSVYAWSGKVVGISDGDTIKILRNRVQVKIRLYGIDTPDKAQVFGNKAKRFTASLVAGKAVNVESVTKDRYGRTVAIVWVPGKNVNEEIVRAGYAWVYQKYCKKSFCNDWYGLESTARSNHWGLWADENATPPWEWRHGSRNTTNWDTSGAFHGNVKSHTLHKPGCRAYNCKNCTKKFMNREKAIEAGYVPCGMRKP